jgi:hypothetical protein
MKKIGLSLLMSLSLLASALAEAPTEATPAISLFDSAERIKSFLRGEARQDYSDKYLSGIRLHFVDGHPRRGLAWLYTFSFKTPRLGGDVSIFHYLDGEIIEFRHGP